MCRDDAVDRVGYPAPDDCAADERAVAAHEAPARGTLVLGQRGEERPCLAVVERQDREALATVEADGDTRSPAAEASAGVVEKHGATEGHRALSNPSSVARTSGPIVSRT
jgi:hypothetical protein